MKFYKFQSWHSGEKRGFRQNPRHFVAAAAFASAEQFQSEIALTPWRAKRLLFHTVKEIWQHVAEIFIEHANNIQGIFLPDTRSKAT
ncbi:hypothetical protein [Desulfovibrio sp. 6_1_46AFAA]|uniref:hypothetical protein n=1 Tax=Desulfovibrio sp. 6_1_46AFAA TaxID=665942 RepID=UPI0012EA1F01|nr:hypothetical protein [Desulfovibrio sp. 6_1_46AFAA]